MTHRLVEAPRWLDAADAATVTAWLLGMRGTLAQHEDRLVLSSPASAPALAAELLRSTLWSLSDGGRTPVHTARFLARCLPAADVLLPVTQSATPGATLEVPIGIDGAGDGATPHGLPVTERSATLRALVDDLVLLGDIAELGHGWWLPAPCRVVALADDWALLLGGPPCAALPATLHASLVVGSVARLFDARPDAVAHALGGVQIQSDADWRRRPAGDIADWASAVLAQTHLLPGVLDPAAIEVYHPALACAPRRGTAPTTPRRPSQYFRWMPLDRRIPDGRHLARVRTVRGPVALIVDVRHAAVTASAPPVLYPGDLRRLCYGLDARDSCPTAVTLGRPAGRGVARFTCTSALPGAEFRLAAALGTLAPAREGTYYPQHWDLGDDVAPTLAVALVAIGVTLTLPPDPVARAALEPLLTFRPSHD
jgi:hypothetical protein